MDLKKSIAVQVLDTTLREGDQKTGVELSAAQKITVLRMLEDFGVRLVEVGHPGISHAHERVCAEIAAAADRAAVLVHSRADVREVRAAARTGAEWIGIWASVNDVARRTKFVGKSVEYILERVREAVGEAKDAGLRVRFTVEDASRTPWELLSLATATATDAGADRISLADTVGVLSPASCSRLVSRVVGSFDREVEVHLHNDMGLALANALASIAAGATVVDASVLGVGERAGITDLIELCVALNRFEGDCRFDLERIPQLVEKVSSLHRHRPDGLRPVTGLNAFTHSSKYHVDAAQRDPYAYEPYAP